jgi:hypothetical protein
MQLFCGYKNALQFLHCRLVVAGYLLRPGIQRDALACIELYKQCGGPNWNYYNEEWPKTNQGVLASRESIPQTWRSEINRYGRMTSLNLDENMCFHLRAFSKPIAMATLVRKEEE